MSMFILNTGRVIFAVGKKAIKKALEKGAKKATTAEKRKFLEKGNPSRTWGSSSKGPRGEVKHVDTPTKGTVLRPGEKFDPWSHRFKKNKGGLMIKPKLAKRGW